MSWSDIISQKRVVETLVSAIRRNRVAHAYLFTGPEGVGKSAAAIEFAKVLNCESGGYAACDACRSCRKFEALQHPNLYLIFPLPVGRNEKLGDDPLAKLGEPDLEIVREQVRRKAENHYRPIVIPKAGDIKINSIRELRRESSLTASEQGRKVFVILGAEKMNDAASNAILKVLEEPQDDTLIILTSPAPDQLLRTIVSRCQQVRFDPLDEEELQRALVDREHAEPHAAALLARLAAGSYDRALRLLETDLSQRRAESTEFLRTALFRSRTELLENIEALRDGMERIELEEFLMLLQTWLHDAMMLSLGREGIVNTDDRQALEKFVGHYRRSDYERALKALERAISLVGKNVYIPLILLTLSTELRAAITAGIQQQGAGSTVSPVPS